jgi:phosphopantetheine adenylyltransferase
MVERMRKSIDKAIGALCYCYEVYFPFIGKATPKEYNLRLYWEDKMMQDTSERFQQLMQAKGSAVKDEEIRQFLYPNETAEERAKAIEEIRENNPEPDFPEFFGS